jgi:hypothetical protein
MSFCSIFKELSTWESCSSNLLYAGSGFCLQRRLRSYCHPRSCAARRKFSGAHHPVAHQGESCANMRGRTTALRYEGPSKIFITRFTVCYKKVFHKLFEIHLVYFFFLSVEGFRRLFLVPRQQCFCKERCFALFHLVLPCFIFLPRIRGIFGFLYAFSRLFSPFQLWDR